MEKEQLKIIIADSNVNLRSIIRTYLKAEGYNNLSVTENGKAAWVKIREASVDLIIADYDLPEMNGLELLTAVRKDNRLKETPFLLISSEVHQDYVAQAAELRVDGYLLKPFSQKLLTDKVNIIFKQRLAPDQGYLTAKEAESLLESGDAEGALKKYQEAIEATKDTIASLHYKVGGVYEKLERDEEAESSYREAIKMSKLHVDSLDALGEIVQKAGQHEEAASYFKKSVSISPLNAQRQFNLGEVLLKTDELEEAEKAFKNALKLDPHQTHVFNRLGISLHRQGKLEESIQYFERALAVTDSDENLCFNAGQVHYMMGNKDAAKKLLKEALELNPNFPEAQALLEKIIES
ncbi:MAG: tetratricopeptide repeat protein [Deltaproteobacteria bacterium]|nr:tetratricopeptide repeat protein [Deltaproteobacteria bacterium]MBW2051202.1 tetratricopeptide repeat protein [Deltaproteobacteria bacterium]MBW2139843.1 tetratricopeptide repeat protein [Deltaproteobacteria bacterium]MBW2322008.1 tetratricopeptide repeat protein [Deltaproteobacteria bacterium]